MKKLFLISLALSLGVIVFVLGLYYFHAGFLDSIELRTYDTRFKVMRGPVPHNSRIGIIAIDEKSIAELGRYPWSREVYTPFLKNLKAAGVKALLMDAFFPEQQDKKIDAAFARAIKDAGFVTLASAIDLAGDPDVPDLTISLPVLTEVARNTAHINFLPDEDGVNRNNILVLPYTDPETEEERIFPSLGLMGAMEALDLTLEDLAPSETSIKLGDMDIPVTYVFTEQEALLPLMLINYKGAPGTYDTYSFADIMQGRIEPDVLKDRILFFGATALGIYDMRESPFHPNTPGVEVHAAVADTILSRSFISKGGGEVMLDMLFIILPSLIVLGISVRYRPIVALPAVVGIIIAYIYFAYFMFLNGSWLSMVYPVFSITLTYAVTGYVRFILIDRKAKEMRSIFSSYVSRKIVDQLADNPEAAKIGGDSKEISILFSDVKGYTSYSEKRTPEEVVKTLNEYLGAMSEVIIDGEGTLDKFLGDGIMAYWGAPLPQANHRELALNCAVGMLRSLEALHKKWLAEGTEPFSIRVGINSGKVVAGNIGAQGKKMEYTVIGDAVNLSSRLEGTAKLYGVTVLVSESTYTPEKDKYVFRELDCIRVVGKSQPIRIYELIGINDASVTQEKRQEVQRFEEGLSLYRSREFEKALDVFLEITASQPKELAALEYAERCRRFITDPPPVDWDGVYTRTSK